MKRSKRLSNCGTFLIKILILCNFQLTTCLSPLWDSVTTNIVQEYDVEEGKHTWVVKMNMGEYKTTDLVVGEDIRPESRLILTCIAHHGPAEWVYSGDGSPDFKTNSTMENLSSNGEILPMDDMNGAKRYIATLTLGRKRLSTRDTGRYNCLTASPATGLQYKTLSAFYHLYVPDGKKLFIRKSGETVHYDLNKSAARIPCGVTNPKTSVTLQKLIKGNLEFLPNGDNMLYHPISGFYPKKDIRGVYICTAAFNNTFDFAHFTLIPTSSLDVSYHNNIKYSNKKTSKKPSKFTKPEDLEWLMYATPAKYQGTKRPEIISSSTTRRNRPSGAESNNTRTSYIPFHIRYTTTYGPFQTFYDVAAPTTSSPNEKYRPTSTTAKPRPFNPFEYPPELLEKITPTRRPTSGIKVTTPVPGQGQKFRPNGIGIPFPPALISYRPIFNYFKDTSRPLKTTSVGTNGTNRPSSTVFSSNRPYNSFNQSVRPAIFITDPDPDLQEDNEELDDDFNKPSATRHTTLKPMRTTPRKYRPNFITTTEIPFPIPETVICHGHNCGKNAICFTNYVRYDHEKDLRPEPACKCEQNYIGNPYLECQMPDPYMDPNVLFFNSSFRVPSLSEPIYSDSNSRENDDGNNSVDRLRADSDRVTSVSIIDM